MRVALYARYSTDKQSETSAADQLAMLRGELGARGWREVAAYTDEGISGSAIRTRPGVQALMRAVSAGDVDVVFVEALDRLSRGQSDVARLYELLTWSGAQLWTPRGQVSEINIGLEGTMNRMALIDLASKTRRGLVGRVKAGFSGGGRCYGYTVAGKGVLAVDPAEAEIVRRIFAAYAGGQSARTIAQRLNAEGVHGPRGGDWAANAIIGDRRAGDGLLCQELYRGQRVFGRRKFRKHPETGRRSSTLNPPDQWIRQPAPELRIVEDSVWAQVQARFEALATDARPMRRQPKRLLSGLLRCGLCGGSMTLQGQKYACANHRERGTCANVKIIAARTVEDRVLDGARRLFLDPAEIAAAVRAYHAEVERVRSAAVRDRLPMEKEIAELDRRFARIMDSYEAGLIESAELATRLPPIRDRKAELTARLAAIEAPQPIQLHPRAGEYWAEIIETLGEALEGEDADDARTAVRGLIDHVDFAPEPGLGEFSLTVHGRLGQVLGISEQLAQGCEVRLGAGTGFDPDLTPVRVSFAA